MTEQLSPAVPGLHADDFDIARPMPVEPDWFKRAVFYEVLVRSFYDSNGDGIGDMSRADREAGLPHLARRRLPVAAPVLRLAAARRRIRHQRLPRRAAGVRHLDDFAALLDAAHARGIRVITDLVHEPHLRPHPWFQESRTDPDGPVRRLLRVGRRRQRLPRRPDHLHRHRDLQLDLRPRSPASTTGTGSSPISPISTTTTPGPGRHARRRCASGSTWASTGSGSTRCRTCSSGKAPTARTCPRRTTSSGESARSSTTSTRAASCSPRPTSGPPTSVEYFGDPRAATSATWPSTSR